MLIKQNQLRKFSQWQAMLSILIDENKLNRYKVQLKRSSPPLKLNAERSSQQVERILDDEAHERIELKSF